MPDSEPEDLEEKVNELEDKLDRVEERTNGKNQIRISAYDLTIDAKSEETSMKNLLRMVSCEMDSLMTRALVGEYQELEEEDLFSMMLGDD